MKFICVSDRELQDSFCALCCEKVDTPYLRELGTRLIYCSPKHYYGHCEVAIACIEYHAREVS